MKFNFKNLLKYWMQILGILTIFLLPFIIYFSQNAYFYNLSKPQLNSVADVDKQWGYSSEILNSYKRKPVGVYPSGNYVVQDYPWPGNEYFKTNSSSLKQNAIDDSTRLLDSSFISEQIATNSLKKHIAADYQYGQENKINPYQPAVDKKIYLDIERYGYITTGLYLPPGEVLTIDFDNFTDEQIVAANVQLYIADNEIDSWDINTERSNWFYRMPNLRSAIKIDKKNFKWGTPFGGNVTVFINANNFKQFTNEKQISFTISGAIESLHYVHGFTTETEWLRLLKVSSAPIADIANDYVNFVVPKHELINFRKTENFTPNPYDLKYFPYKYMDLWYKFVKESYYLSGRDDWSIRNIRMNSTNYVKAGEAYAAVNAYYVCMPWYWTHGVLNYESSMTEGMWGLAHEFNHHHQAGKDNSSWGFTGEDEVSNNVLTLASYLRYTNVYENRDGSKDNTGLEHQHKLNGYRNQFVLNNMQVDSTLNTNRNGIDSDYAVLMSQFGLIPFENALRWYTKNKNIKDVYGNLISPFSVEEDKLSRNLKYAYIISRMTGYNWSQYFLDSKILINSDAEILNRWLKSVEQTNGNVFIPYIPVFSFLANQIDYNADSNLSKGYQKVQNDFLLPAKYFNQGYSINLENDLISQTSLDATKTKLYNISNISIIKTPYYGSLTPTNNSNEFVYKPNLNYKNKVDEIEFSATVQRNNAVVTSHPSLLESEYKAINVKFKIQIKLEGNNIPLVTPDLEKKYIGYSHTNIIDSFSKVNHVYLEKINNQHYWSNENTEINLLKNNKGVFQVYMKPDNLENIAKLTFSSPEEIDINNVYVRFHDNQGRASSIQINANGNQILPKTDITSNIFNQKIPHFKTKSFEIIFTKINDGANFIKIGELDLNFQLPKGSKKFKMSSNNIQLFGDWRNSITDGYPIAGRDAIYTVIPYTKAYLGFMGNAIALYGSKDNRSGKIDIYIDDVFYQTVNLYSKYRKNNDLLFIADLGNNINQKHILKIVTKNSKEVELTGIDVNNYGSEINGDLFYPNVSDSYYILVTVIPILLLIVLITLAVLCWFFIFKKAKRLSKNNKKK